jgi:hypothetical protein
MTMVAYGLAFPASRGVLGVPVPSPLDQIGGVTITGAYSLARLLLSSFAGQSRGRVRDTSGAGTSFADFETPAQATTFLAGNPGAIVSLYDQTGNARTFANATAGAQPAFETGIGSNSRAGVTYDATDDKLSGPNWQTFISTSAGWAYTVARLNSHTGNGRMFWTTAGGYRSAFASTTGLYALGYDGANRVTPLLPLPDIGDLFVYEWWHEGGTLYCAVNGGTPQSIALGSGGAADVATLFGYNTVTALDATILEHVFASARPAQADDVVADMKSYYGIA